MGKKQNEYNVIATEIINAGRFRIVCDTILQNGEKYPYSYVQMKNCVAVLCMANDKIILLKQYRHTLKSWEYEIPAGSVEPGENLEDAAKREVLEETGYMVSTLISLGWYHLSVGATTEKVFLYFANCNMKVGQQLEALEKIYVQKFSLYEFEELIKTNKFHQCMGVAAWDQYKRHCKNVQ